jgi:hypothetical protein
MEKRRLILEGPGAQGTVVNATLLRELLGLIIDGSQRALRMRTQGRSTARGMLPRWITAASDFSVELLPGSTVLEITAPSLVEADPEEFRQQDLFPEINAELTGFDYLADSIDAALTTDERPDFYDRDFLKLLRGFEPVFDHGVESIAVQAKPEAQRRTVTLRAVDLGGFADLERRIPAPQRVRIAGQLDTIRYSDRTFTVQVGTGDSVRGVTDSPHSHELKSLWGKMVVVSGTAHFTPTGRVLRIEADSLHSATERDTTMWSLLPVPSGLLVPPAELRVAQGPRSGVNAIIGKWPGDESDDDILAELERLS